MAIWKRTQHQLGRRNTNLFPYRMGCKVLEQWGEVLEVHPLELIKYSLFAPRPDLEDKPENYFIMHYIIEKEKGETKLQIIQEDNRPGAVQMEEQGEENPTLKMLKELAEAV